MHYHFTDDSFQTINCTGTDKQLVPENAQKHKIYKDIKRLTCNSRKPAVVKKQMQNTKPSYPQKLCAYHCAQLWYTIQLRTALIIFLSSRQSQSLRRCLLHGKGLRNFNVTSPSICARTEYTLCNRMRSILLKTL